MVCDLGRWTKTVVQTNGTLLAVTEPDVPEERSALGPPGRVARPAWLTGSWAANN